MSHTKRLSLLYCLVLSILLLTACSLEQGDQVDVPTGKVTVGALRTTRPGEEPVWRLEHPPIQLIYQGQLNHRAIRWIQIVLRAEPRLIPQRSRPNFDGVISKDEAGQIVDPTDQHLVERNLRIRAHDPFYGPEPRPQFQDSPALGYDRFETYIVLCQIDYRDNPRQWKASILQVFLWQYEKGKNPMLNKVNHDGSGSFKHSLNQAIQDFSTGGNLGFKFDEWYTCPAGGGPPASGTDPCKQP